MAKDWSKSTDNRVIDEDACWKMLGELGAADDWTFMVELLQTITEDHAFEELWAGGDDYKKLQEAAHRLKGTALQCNLPALSKTTYMLDSVFKQLSAEKKEGLELSVELLRLVGPLVSKLQADLDDLKEYIALTQEGDEGDADEGDEGDGGVDEEEEEGGGGGDRPG
mmetsp:Transcript_9356/g.17774  ORF Transcript_9356/g.17774 Transcript_9356/m.17774 type:complete len:167 (+) Transcript_9356:53-553(+)|eukprot:CAMPEP_0175142078 /NCGR_PEP_ID=MMETSP0087-20121206/12551_1 /TAXON_ID=136419 /ORGANISM="Unknown Unknown, Strain D1" /LENGTH=166 /DNA_ID=CAMNT_0016425745 /DNA_START=52 /DNA_END=552 /DNA_ORIENTATION=-